MNTVFIVGIVQGVFVLALLLSKKKTSVERVLVVWLFLVVIHLSYSYLARNEIFTNRFIGTFNNLIPFLQGPMLYLYFTSLYASRINVRKMAIHFLPAALLLTFLITGVVNNTLGIIFYIYVLAAVPLYILWILRCVSGISKQNGDEARSLSGWLKLPVIGLGVIWGTFLILEFLINQDFIEARSYLFIAVSLFVYLIAFHFYRNGDLSKNSELKPETSRAVTLSTVAKYSKSGLSDVDASRIHRRLMEHMEKHEPYLSPDISILSVAASLEVRVNHLSQVVNQIEKKSFNELVNKYRVREFVNHYQSDKTESMLAVAFQCGFRSKSSFNRAFRKELGQSPKIYFQSL